MKTCGDTSRVRVLFAVDTRFNSYKEEICAVSLQTLAHVYLFI